MINNENLKYNNLCNEDGTVKNDTENDTEWTTLCEIINLNNVNPPFKEGDNNYLCISEGDKEGNKKLCPISDKTKISSSKSFC